MNSIRLSSKHAFPQFGFTLIELLVVVMLLALLAGLVVPNLLGKTESAKGKAAESQVQLLTSMVTEYYVVHGEAPESLSQLVPDFAKPSQLNDPWGQKYYYKYPGEYQDFDIYTLGADNQPGGEGKNRDINSWE
jgi:general secretion pathway protein G